MDSTTGIIDITIEAIGIIEATGIIDAIYDRNDYNTSSKRGHVGSNPPRPSEARQSGLRILGACLIIDK